MNKKAFSLIELIVGITISMILMVSVGVFISSGMQNIFLQQKVLENTSNFTDFAGNLNTTFNLIQSGSFAPVETASGILFKRGQNFGEGGFTYIGTELIDEIYCLSGSEDTLTNSIYIKNFIPFEENGEDIFNDAMGGYTGTLTSKEITVNGNTYKSFQKEHIITKNGAAIVGKGIFGDKFTEGGPGTDIYLNSPTGLASSGSILFISDTLNNRILYLDSNNKIHLLLDESDGLNEPTGLYYEDNSLYIANSGNGEILKYSSKSTAINSPLNLSFSGVTANNINKFSLDFLGGTVNISSPNENTEIDIFSFSNIENNTDYLTGSTNKLEYYFADYSNPSISSIIGCSFSGDKTTYYLDGENPKKDIITGCNSSTGTLITYSGNKTTNFVNGNNYEINIDNITPLLNNTGSYYVNLKLFDGTTEKYSGYFPYFTQSDNNLTTLSDNILTVEIPGLNYPTGIWGISNYNQFGTHTFNDKILAYHDTDILLGTPIESLDIDTLNYLISFLLKYYKRYDCYNLDDNAERTFLLKKNLK